MAKVDPRHMEGDSPYGDEHGVSGAKQVRPGESVSVSVRKIENGYITRTETYRENGEMR